MESLPTFEKGEGSSEAYIVFNQEKEVERVENTLKKLAWYREHYGDRNSRLPSGINEQSSPEEIRNAVSAEFSEGMYKECATYIEEEWPIVSSGLEKLKEIPEFHSFDTYKIILTRYGSGGSYHPESGTVLANIAFHSKEQVLRTIAHEIVHIGIEHFIQTYNVRHWYKERLVDLIGARYFADMKQQNLPEDTSAVDTAFETHFPDVEAIARAIGEERKNDSQD